MLPGTDFMVVGWSLAVFTFLLVVNRLYIKSLRQPWALGDYLVIIAWLFYVAQMVCDSYMYSTGEFSDYGLMNSEGFAKVGWVENFIYYIVPYCVKGVFLCFYLDITPVALVKIRVAIWIGVAFTVGGALFTEINYLTMCRPLSNNWDPNYDGDCAWASPTLTFAICWHMFTDIYIYAIPFFLLSKIPLPSSRSSKVGTSFMFASGFFCVLLAVPNLISTFWDPINETVLWCYWIGQWEQGWPIAVACLPALRITLRRFSRRTWDEGSNSSSSAKRRSGWEAWRDRGAISLKEVNNLENQDSSTGTTKGANSNRTGATGNRTRSDSGGLDAVHFSPSTKNRDSAGSVIGAGGRRSLTLSNHHRTLSGSGCGIETVYSDGNISRIIDESEESIANIEDIGSASLKKGDI